MYYVNDWTYDLFFEDSKLYKAMPRKGVYPRRNASDRERFMIWLKNAVRDFRAEWKAAGRNDWDLRRGWIGDAFAAQLGKMGFSDYYKDVYNQRPHLETWYYVHAIGLPTGQDTIRMFCSSPIENAVESAKRIREEYSSI